jgi:type VI secretion system protein ImpJ
VSRSGPCWDHICDSKRVGIYVPSDIPSPQIELLVLLDS